MDLVKYYYSLVQYKYNHDRQEVMNIGLLLLDINNKSLKSKFLQDYNNLIIYYNNHVNSKHIEGELEIFKNSLSSNKELHIKNNLEKFIRIKRNNISLTELKYIKIRNSEKGIDEDVLFNRLVVIKPYLEKTTVSSGNWEDYKDDFEQASLLYKIDPSGMNFSDFDASKEALRYHFPNRYYKERY